MACFGVRFSVTLNLKCDDGCIDPMPGLAGSRTSTTCTDVYSSVGGDVVRVLIGRERVNPLALIEATAICTD